MLFGPRIRAIQYSRGAILVDFTETEPPKLTLKLRNTTAYRLSEVTREHATTIQRGNTANTAAGESEIFKKILHAFLPYLTRISLLGARAFASAPLLSIRNIQEYFKVSRVYALISFLRYCCSIVWLKFSILLFSRVRRTGRHIERILCCL